MTRRVLPVLVALCLWPAAARAQSCTYSVNPVLDFGTITGLPTPQRDFTTTVELTCVGVLTLLNARACLSLPPGSAGATIADRRLTNGASTVEYQIYTDPGRTQIWGELGGSSPPLAVDFPALALAPRTITATLYGRVFANQSGVSVGTYESTLAPIRSRLTSYALLFPPDCTSVNSSAETLPAITSRLTIDTGCEIATTPLAFGTVTSLTAVAPASTNLSVACTSGGAYSVALDGGSVSGNVTARQMRRSGGTDTIDYTLSHDAAHMVPWSATPVPLTGTGTAQSIAVHGLVPTQGPKPGGVYEDTITLTVTF